MKAIPFFRNVAFFMLALCLALTMLAMSLQRLIHATTSEGLGWIAGISCAVALVVCAVWADHTTPEKKAGR